MIPLGVLASSYVAPAGGGVAFTQEGISDVGTSASVATVTGLSLGDPSATRTIVALIGLRWGTSRSITGITISGETATIDSQYVGSLGTILAARASVPTGTTGDVVVTTNDAMAWHYISAAIYAFNYAPTVTDAASGASRSVTLSGSSGGVIVSHCFINQSGSGDLSWTGLDGQDWASAKNSIYYRSSGGTTTTAGEVTVSVYAPPTVNTPMINAVSYA